MITVRQVSKCIGKKEILRDISFEVATGECVALIGKNGAGKTTLLECLIGDKFLSAGEISVMGLKSTDEKTKQFLAMLLQQTTFLESVKVYELIRFFQQVYQDSLTTEEVDNLLQFSSEQKKQYATKLSGGQKRLLSFVLMLIGKPKIILLDEPTASMDTSTRHRFWEIIDMLKQQQVTIIYSSHYIEEVEHTADRILVLHQGRLIEDTTPYALRYQKREKQFVIPVQYKDIIEPLDVVSSLRIKQDTIEFMTKHPQIVWDRLMQAACPIEEIDMTNKTLLNILFEQSEEEANESLV